MLQFLIYHKCQRYMYLTQSAANS